MLHCFLMDICYLAVAGRKNDQMLHQATASICSQLTHFSHFDHQRSFFPLWRKILGSFNFKFNITNMNLKMTTHATEGTDSIDHSYPAQYVGWADETSRWWISPPEVTGRRSGKTQSCTAKVTDSIIRISSGIINRSELWKYPWGKHPPSMFFLQ